MKQEMQSPSGGCGIRQGFVRPSIAVALALLAAVPAMAQSSREVWRRQPARSAASRDAAARPAAIRPTKAQSLSLDRRGLAALLAGAPRERTLAAKQRPLVIELPDPKGGFQRFELVDSPVMEKALAARHPEIKTYSGRGLDDPGARIRADLSPLGFHASVRSTKGAWYIDPAHPLDQSVYLSYFRRDVRTSPHGAFSDILEAAGDASEISTTRAYYRPADAVTLRGSGFGPNAQVSITISDPREAFGERSLSATADELGGFEAEFTAAPDAALGPHSVEASDGSTLAMTIYDVLSDDDASHDPPTGDPLRVYRLALITDPGYATYFGGPDNVTAAKVALMNRVNQLYEGDMAIRLVLVDNNDLLNFDTWDEAIGPNGPCGTAACFTQAAVTGCSNLARNRIVIGQIIGASNYDIGHLALGQPGGGVAQLGVIGRSAKAQGCTGIPTPVGDFYAVDYVAHEMGHQFAGNHTFNGNQLNCSGGNRNAATSVEPGSGSTVMAYAGICLTDDLQPHSDPYFSQRSLQEIVTYVTGTPAAINEVQNVGLRHFGGGNEVQTVTFGPGFAPASTIQPLTLNINAAPGTTSRGGAEEDGNDVTIAVSASHTLKVGDTVTIAGVAVADYNGSWVVTAVPSSRSFKYTNPVAGLANSGGGTVTLAVPGATESGTTVTISTAADHNRVVGQNITIAGVNPTGYNGTFVITAVPTSRTFQYTAAVGGLASGGGGTATLFSPFQVHINGADTAVIGGSGIPYSAVNLQAAINTAGGLPADSIVVTGAASTGFTLTYSGAAVAATDVANVSLVNLSCGGCFASVEETNHGGAFDSFTVSYNGVDSIPIVNGTNYTAALMKAAIEGIAGWPAGGTVTVQTFGGGNNSQPNSNGFQVAFGGTLAAANVAPLGINNLTLGATAIVGETDQGGTADGRGGNAQVTGNSFPTIAALPSPTIPIRTPFYLTGSASDADSHPLVYAWEQNDRGAAGVSLLNNVKPSGPLFAVFAKSAPISESDTLLYGSPNENQLSTSPTRYFPDLQQVLDNNTNADTGQCPEDADIAPPIPIPTRECFSEFLPTADYVGFAGVNDSPLRLNFRFTVRDGFGGTNAADTSVFLEKTAGPFRVTAPDTDVEWQGGALESVTWDVANTDVPPISTALVTISLSVDGGHTYPYVLAADTPNDGEATITVPNVNTTTARLKVEAVDNVYYDVSNADFDIVADVAAPSVAVVAPNGGETAFSGHPYRVSWTASDAVSLAAFDVFVSYNAGVSYDPTPVCDEVPGDARSCDAVFTVAAANSKVRVRVVARDGAGNTAADASNANFKVVLGTPSITVTNPNTAGAALQVGLSKPIVFSHNLGARSPVRIEVNRTYSDGNWETIAAETLTTGASNSTFRWLVTSPTTLGATARIRVTSLAIATVSDTSDVSFSITSAVKVTQPNVFSKWKIGSAKVIKYSHTYPAPHDFSVSIDRDGDGICEESITASTTAAAANATYNWVVTGPAGATNRICVTSTTDPFGTDISDVNFTIQP